RLLRVHAGLALGFDSQVRGVAVLNELPALGPYLEPRRAVTRNAVGDDLAKALALGAVLRAVGSVGGPRDEHQPLPIQTVAIVQIVVDAPAHCVLGSRAWTARDG